MRCCETSLTDRCYHRRLEMAARTSWQNQFYFTVRYLWTQWEISILLIMSNAVHHPVHTAVPFISTGSLMTALLPKDFFPVFILWTKTDETEKSTNLRWCVSIILLFFTDYTYLWPWLVLFLSLHQKVENEETLLHKWGPSGSSLMLRISSVVFYKKSRTLRRLLLFLMLRKNTVTWCMG